nr:MAG TPA_asm: hypothetical protein [Caudoviricetes sp.]
MARRLSKEEQRLLQEQAVDQWLLGEYERRNRFAGVEGGFDSTAPIYEEPVVEEVEEDEGYAWPSRTQLLLNSPVNPFSPLMNRELRDAAIGFGGTALESVGAIVDAVAPDPHAIAMGMDDYESGLTPSLYARSALESVRDLGGSIPQLAGSVADWAGIPRDVLMPPWMGDSSGAEQAVRNREAADIARERAEAGLISPEDLRTRALPNRIADALYEAGAVVGEQVSPELQAAQQELGLAIEGGMGDTARFLASPQGVRALATGVIPQSAAYAAQGYGVGALGRAARAPASLSTAAANTTLAYTIAQQNANEVEQGILALSDEEAILNPVIREEWLRTNDLEAAKTHAARVARQQTIAASAAISPLYGVDVFSRAGAGVGSAATSTLQRRVGQALAVEGAGEFAQEASESLAADFGQVGGGQMDARDVGQTALASGMLGAIASAPLAGSMSYGQARSEFGQRADGIEEAAARLEALYAQRAAREQAQAEQQAAAEAVEPDAPESDDIDVDAANALLRTVEDNADIEAARLALSGIPADTAGRPEAQSTPFDMEEEARRNELLLALEPENEAEQEAWRLLRSMPAGPELDGRPVRGEDGRFTGERIAPDRSVQLRDSRGRLTSQRSDGVPNPNPGVDALTRDAQRLADSLVAEQQAEAEADDARITRESQLQRAREFDQQEQERGDKEAAKRLATAKGQHTRKMRAHLAEVRDANMHLDPEARAEAIADAEIEWLADNPRPTLETLPPEAPRASRQRAPRRPVRTPRPGSRPAPAAPEAAVEPVAEEAPTTVPEDRREALRARYGRAQEGGEAPAGRTAAEVLRALAPRVRRGTDSSALAAEALLSNEKLSIVDPDVMATVEGATEATEGYYDGERMYINAASLPAGDPVGVLFNSVLAHEANHAATMSQNPDAVSKARVLLEDAPRRKLIEQLETANHPTAIAAREAVAARNIDKEADPSRYEDEIVAYAINHAIESGGRSWAPIRGIVSAARRKWNEFTGSGSLNLEDLGHYARATVNALAESEVGINAPGVGREQIAMHGTPATFAPEEGAPLGRMRSDKALTGEGAQAYGAGHYLTQQWDTAENRYRTRLSEDRGAQSSREKALAEAIESSRWAVESPSDLTAEDVVDRLRYLDQHWTSERNRMQSVVDNSADELDRGYYETRVAEIDEDLAAIRSALELAENSDLRQMTEMADDSRDGDAGEVYYADIPEDSEMMHWQEPVSARSQELQDALLSIDPDANLEQPFASWYIQRSQNKGLGRLAGDRAVSNELAAVGIKGHIFTGRMDGARNFVVYSDDDVSIGGRDRRELGESRREMEAFGEEIQSRPDSSRSLREQFEAEARERVAADRAAHPRTELELAPFEGRAQEPVSRAQEAAANQNRGPYLRTKGDGFAAAVKDLFTVHGSIGEGTGVLMQEANYARDAVYQTAVHRYHRVGPAMDKAADKAMANEEGTLRDKRARFNDMILERIDNIAQLPSEDVKDKALARLVQQYPDLAPLQEAIHDINKMTEEIISARFAYADSRPLTEEEWTLYDYMHNNKYGYLTNVYAAFQGKDGKKYAEAVMSAGREGLAALSRGEEVPANIKRLYQVYDDALTFVMNNDVAVSDPEMLAAMDVKDVAELYNRWMPDGIRADALATEFREGNNGTLDTDSYKAYMEDAIAEHVSMLQDPEFVTEDGTTGSQILYNEANAVLNGLLGLTPLPNTALRYAKVRGIDTTVLEHRKPLPGPIAELYGQIRDIPSLINATLTRQGELASRLNFFNKLATEAYGDAVISAADRHKAGNEAFTVPLEGPSFGRLNGMYTTHEMAQRLTDYGSMFTDLVDTIAVVGVNPTIGRRWMEHRVGKVWTTGAGMQKAMKIVTRPDYTLLNLAGSFSAPVLAGGVKPSHLLTGMKVALEHIALQIDPKGRTVGPELSAAHQLALQTGAFDNAVTQELRRAPRKLVNRLLEEMTTVDTVGEAMSLLKRAYNWSNDRGWQTLVESYSLADTWVKLPVLLERMDYLESYYRANGDSVTNDRIQEEAARYMRDATISMDNVPGFAKFLERGGISFYLPYFASVFRTLHKSNVHIVDSLEMAANAKTPEARWIAHKDAGRKLAGVSTVWATAAAGLRLVAEMGMSDDDREQMERDRELMFDEGKYGDLTYVGTNDQGHRQYFVASRTDQFGPAFDAVRRFQRTGSVEESLKAIPEELLELLVMNRFFGATIDHVARGGKDTQLERTFPKATEFLLTQANKVPGGYAAMDYALTVGDLVSPAGIMNYFDPRNKTPVEVDGDAAAILAALTQGTGHKLLTVNPEAALGGKGWAVSNHRRDANSRIRDSIQNLGPRQGFKTFLREASRERALMEDLGNAYHAMIDSGMSRQQVEEMISSVDATTIRNLRNRAYTSESARWIKEFSGLLSRNSINNPPEFRDLPEEERAEAQEEWKRQAFEMNRMLNALGLEENK